MADRIVNRRWIIGGMITPGRANLVRRREGGRGAAEQFRGRHDAFPDVHADILGMAPGTTYAQAARKVRRMLIVVGPGAAGILETCARGSKEG
jgi:hypothetical protein